MSFFEEIYEDIFILAYFFVFLQRKIEFLKKRTELEAWKAWKTAGNAILGREAPFFLENNNKYFHLSEFFCIFAKEKGLTEKIWTDAQTLHGSKI